jgi:hypothetical protein
MNNFLVAFVVFCGFVCETQVVYSAETTPPNNNSDGNSFKSNFTTSTVNKPTTFEKTLNATRQKVITDPAKKEAVMPGTQGLPESQILLRHDDVAPGLNRQQAMELEAQNGKLPPYVEQEMQAKGLIKDAKKPIARPAVAPRH